MSVSIHFMSVTLLPIHHASLAGRFATHQALVAFTHRTLGPWSASSGWQISVAARSRPFVTVELIANRFGPQRPIAVPEMPSSPDR